MTERDLQRKFDLAFDGHRDQSGSAKCKCGQPYASPYSAFYQECRVCERNREAEAYFA